MKITEEELQGSINTTKRILKHKALAYQKECLSNSGKDKSKVQFLLKGYKNNQTIKGNSPKYMKELTRNQCSILLKARNRMLKVKNNYKNGYKTLECRLCKKVPETQQHILEECESLHTTGNLPKIKEELIFDENTKNLKKTAKNLQEIVDAFEDKLAPS